MVIAPPHRWVKSIAPISGATPGLEAAELDELLLDELTLLLDSALLKEELEASLLLDSELLEAELPDGRLWCELLLEAGSDEELAWVLDELMPDVEDDPGLDVSPPPQALKLRINPSPAV